MPGQRCAVAICNNFYDKRKGEENVSYFSLPKDESIRKQWIIACRRDDKFNPNTSRVCSAHFKEDDFVPDLKAKLLNLRPKMILKHTGKNYISNNSNLK